MGRRTDEIQDEIWGRDSEGGSHQAAKAARQPIRSTRVMVSTGGNTISPPTTIYLGVIFSSEKFAKYCTNAGKIFGCDLSF